MEQARRLAERDPEASGHLFEQLAALPDVPPVDSYNPTELYAVLALECHWTPTQIDNEHYPRLFHLVREISRIRERQKEDQALSGVST